MNTLSQLFFENSSLYQEKTLFGFKKDNGWDHISWIKASDLVQDLSLGLRHFHYSTCKYMEINHL